MVQRMQALWVGTSFAKGDSCEMAARIQASSGAMEPSVAEYCASFGLPAPVLEP